jgi:DNA repair protein RecO (recombination protein O)
MTTKTLQAWVIHKQWSGDTSAKVYFFTRELGLVQCLCRGGRTPKKQALLQAFTPLLVHMDERYNQYYTKSLESISPTLPLAGHSLFSGLYLNELLYHTLKPLYSDESLFNAYLMTLNGLATSQDRLVIEALLRRFEWTVLTVCGHYYSFTEEFSSNNLVKAHEYYRFIPGEGFVLAKQGIPGEHLLALAADNLNEPPYLKSAKIIMRQAIDHLLGGRELKARSLYL